MPRSRKKKNDLLSHLITPAPRKRKRQPKPEDFVGKFLLSILTGTVTALVSLALTHQVDWPIVALVFVTSLLILATYQSRQ